MNKTAIAFLTKNKGYLTVRIVGVLLKQPFDLFWFDGSETEEGKQLPYQYGIPPDGFIYPGVVGGPDAAVAYALTELLGNARHYDFIGLCENDVLLPPHWFDETMHLFDKGRAEGLEVGAVSPRCYEDRVLFQRDGYAVMHNLGWGCQIMTRQAAQLALKNFRTGWTNENRRTFCNLSRVDIGAYWAFQSNDHQVCADWHNDHMLASHGFASLALTPSPVEMIGQTPPLAEQGLKLVAEPVEVRRDNAAFDRYVETTRKIRDGEVRPPANGVVYRDDTGASLYFAHQVFLLENAGYDGDWRLKWVQGFGPFAWQAGEAKEEIKSVFRPECQYPMAQFPALDVTISGPCEFLVSGGEKGGQVHVEDLRSGYSVKPTLPPVTNQVMSLVAPCGVSRRTLRLTALSPDVLFYGIKCREPQPERLNWSFDHSVLPPV